MKIPGMLTVKILKILKDVNDVDDRVKDVTKVLKVADKVAGTDPKKLDKRDFSGIFGNPAMSEAEKKLDAVEAKLARVLSEKMDWPDQNGEHDALDRMEEIKEKFGEKSKEMIKAIEVYEHQLSLTAFALHDIDNKLAEARAQIPLRRKALAAIQKVCDQIDKAAKKIVKFPRVGGVDPQVLALTLMQNSELLSGTAHKADLKYSALDKKLQKEEKECSDLLFDNKYRRTVIAKMKSPKEGEFERQKKKL